MSVAIRKLGKAAKKRLKRYRQAEDSFVFHTGNRNPGNYVNPPKMDINMAEEFLSSGGRQFILTPNKTKTRKKRKKGRGSLPLRKS
tara:strand:+ start:37 stop:294 length:258 start_codon:yes stop_codon:yes gene_type:complete